MVKTLLRHKIILVLFSIALFLLLLESMMRLAGFLHLWILERNNSTVSIQGEYRILCLGESTTAWGGDHSYPRQLERLLNADSSGRKVRIINKGVPAVSSFDIVSKARDYLKEYRPHLVIIMMGINDSKSTMSFNDSVQESFWNSLRIVKLFRFIEEALSKRPKVDHTLTNWDNVGLAQVYEDQHKWKEAEEAYYEQMRLFPESMLGYLNMAKFYERLNRPEDALHVYKEAVEKSSETVNAYNALAAFYRYQGQDDMLVDMILRFEQTGKDCQDCQMYVQLGNMYIKNKEFAKAEESFLKAVRKRNVAGYEALLDLYLKDPQKNADKIQQTLFSSRTLDEKFLMKLVYALENKNQWELAGRLLEMALHERPQSSRVHEALAAVYRKNGRPEDALKEDALAKVSQIPDFFLSTQLNYKELVRIMEGGGAKVIAMQYPMRSVDVLKNMLDSKNLVYIDNESLFKQAVQKNGYKFYFVDIFGGNFGHATKEGNRLLAEHVAQEVKSFIH